MPNIENIAPNALLGYGAPTGILRTESGSARAAVPRDETTAIIAVSRNKLNKKVRVFEKKGFKRSQLVVTPDGHVQYDPDQADALSFHRAFQAHMAAPSSK